MITAFKVIFIVVFILSIAAIVFLQILKFGKNKRSSGPLSVVFGIISLAAFVILIVSYSNREEVKYYDKNGNEYEYQSDVQYRDADNNIYTYDFDKTGFDYLYINNTDKRLAAYLCYLDKDGYVIYDGDMSITVKDENSCSDTDGTVYYPVKYSYFNKDGSIFSVFPSDYEYDMFGNAYTYDYVPFYDRDENKYMYSFDSNAQKGYYTNISTGESYENEYTFVDENGYLVYDKDHILEKSSDETENKVYYDNSGNKYYWASSVYWDENGILLVA